MTSSLFFVAVCCMCSKPQLRTELTALFGLLIVGTFVLFGLGVWMIVDGDGQIAYGNQVANWGGGYLFVGIIVAIGVLFGIFGSRRHNKFALSASLCCNCFACFILFIVVVTIMVQVSPTYPPSVASACVARGAEAAPISDKCMKYYTDMGNIRLFRLWMSDYVKSETQPVVRAYMLGIEDGHFCCGWGPPLQCENATGSNNYTLNGVELLKSDRPIAEALQRCSFHRGWYQVGLYCDKVDGAAHHGCPYMFSQSSICLSEFTTRGGCAGAFQTILASRFNGIAGGGVAIIVTQVCAMIVTCCYCFKRKYTDVLPPYEVFSAKEYEKYRYGIPGKTFTPMKVEAPPELKPQQPNNADANEGGEVKQGGAGVGEEKVDIGVTQGNTVNAAVGTGLATTRTSTSRRQ